MNTQYKDPKKLIGIETARPAKAAIFAEITEVERNDKTNFPTNTFKDIEIAYSITCLGICFFNLIFFALKVIFLLKVKLKIIEVSIPKTLEITKREVSK